MSSLKDKKEKDLLEMLRDKREELRSLRFGTAGSKTRDVRAQRNTKKEIAQVLTELKARTNEVRK